MKIFAKRNEVSPAVNDRIAKILADFILKAQTRMAEECTKRFNAYSSAKKKLIFLLLFLALAAILLLSTFSDYYTIPQLKQTYKPATHIGMASDVNSTGKKDVQLTDSLTTNH